MSIVKSLISHSHLYYYYYYYYSGCEYGEPEQMTNGAKCVSQVQCDGTRYKCMKNTGLCCPKAGYNERDAES